MDINYDSVLTTYERLRQRKADLEARRDALERELQQTFDQLLTVALHMRQYEVHLVGLDQAADIVAAMETEAV